MQRLSSRPPGDIDPARALPFASNAEAIQEAFDVCNVCRRPDELDVGPCLMMDLLARRSSEHAQGRRQRGGRRGLQPPYCLHNKGTLLQSPLKFSTINECLGVEEGVHTLTCTTMELSFSSQIFCYK
jgi:hypothetical protein